MRTRAYIFVSEKNVAHFIECECDRSAWWLLFSIIVLRATSNPQRRMAPHDIDYALWTAVSHSIFFDRIGKSIHHVITKEVPFIISGSSSTYPSPSPRPSPNRSNPTHRYNVARMIEERNQEISTQCSPSTIRWIDRMIDGRPVLLPHSHTPKPPYKRSNAK